MDVSEEEQWKNVTDLWHIGVSLAGAGDCLEPGYELSYQPALYLASVSASLILLGTMWDFGLLTTSHHWIESRQLSSHNFLFRGPGIPRTEGWWNRHLLQLLLKLFWISKHIIENQLQQVTPVPCENIITVKT